MCASVRRPVQSRDRGHLIRRKGTQTVKEGSGRGKLKQLPESLGKESLKERFPPPGPGTTNGETELKAVCAVPLVWGCSQLVSERPAGPAWALTDADGFGKYIWGVEYSAPFIYSHHQQLLVFLQACDDYTWKIFELIHQLGPHFQICFITRSVCQGADNTTIVGKYSLGMLQLRIISL